MTVKSEQPTLHLPRFRPDQWRIVSHPAKTKICVMGRRWGKTVMAGNIALGTAAAGGSVAWVVPIYRNAAPIWRWIESTAAHLIKAKIARVNRSTYTMTFTNGGLLSIYTADNPTGILGNSFHLVVIDEAARIDGSVYYETIRPTLADYDGEALLISTPKGRNWFYHEYLAAQAQSDMVAFHAPTSDNPMPTIRAAAEMARLRLSERTYRQEWLAQFLDDGGEVFRRVRDAVYHEADAPERSGQTVIGVDLGRSHDSTVFCVIDLVNRAVLELDRFTDIEMTIQLGRLQALCERYKPQAVIIETNFNSMFAEQAARIGLPVMPFTTTNATKQVIIDALALAFERGEIRIPDAPVLITELEAYTLERLPSGLIRYGAPSGMHDDTVIALALAWYAVQFGRVDFGRVIRF